ncbi:hypothetical protein MKEN_01121900 [Mycena kentingensis (nom. inval.)]|nr:hypothetical protein MKEN_01121900 [Mycena kentingensis (nom. inval.)]
MGEGFVTLFPDITRATPLNACNAKKFLDKAAGLMLVFDIWAKGSSAFITPKTDLENAIDKLRAMTKENDALETVVRAGGAEKQLLILLRGLAFLCGGLDLALTKKSELSAALDYAYQKYLRRWHDAVQMRANMFMGIYASFNAARAESVPAFYAWRAASIAATAVPVIIGVAPLL